jgi:beta-lactamase superfamily II metal-dependent hydrolase
MPNTRLIAVDLANVWDKPSGTKKQLLRTLAWGDRVDVVKETATYAEVKLPYYVNREDGGLNWSMRTGYILCGSKSKAGQVTMPVDNRELLKVDFIDVQQGDASVIETPDGQVILVDGGDNKLFARYLASRFRNTSPDAPQVIDLILVTHGDADHFAGLAEILKSETHDKPAKRLFIKPLRVYHNGLVKRPSTVNKKSVPDVKLLGATTKKGNDTYITGLEEDLLAVADVEMNQPFLEWKKALKEYANYHGLIEFKRLEYGKDSAFNFLKAGKVTVDVLGPITANIGGKPALKFLGDPPGGPRVGHDSVSLQPLASKGLSASHTINGHSVVFRLTYGGFNFLFSGDLNDEASRYLATKHGAKLRSTVFKVPHHGSADFSGGFIQKVEPVVSVISSGDESSKKEYIHPRATLVGALGRYSRVEEPLIFCTELVAFFRMLGYARLTDKKKDQEVGEFFAFDRTNFGMVKMRTNGKRLLVYTNSGNVRMKEAYAYKLDKNGEPVPDKVSKI